VSAALVAAENEGNYLKAVELYREFARQSKLTTGSPNARFWCKKGECEVRVKLFEDALNSFKKSIEAVKEGDDLWKCRALLGFVYSYQELGQQENAAEALAEVRDFLRTSDLAKENWVQSQEILRKLEEREKERQDL